MASFSSPPKYINDGIASAYHGRCSTLYMMHNYIFVYKYNANVDVDRPCGFHHGRFWK